MEMVAATILLPLLPGLSESKAKAVNRKVNCLICYRGLKPLTNTTLLSFIHFYLMQKIKTVIIDDIKMEVTNVVYDEAAGTITLTLASNDDPLKRIPISKLELSSRNHKFLERAGIKNLGDLIKKTEKELKSIRSLGSLSIAEIKTELEKMGLHLTK